MFLYKYIFRSSDNGAISSVFNGLFLSKLRSFRSLKEISAVTNFWVQKINFRVTNFDQLFSQKIYYVSHPVFARKPPIYLNNPRSI